MILASASPRRRELLSRLGVQFTCQPADIDESVHTGESPEDYVERMAREKAAVVVAATGGAIPVLASDTSVVIDNDVLGKPRDHFDGLAMLARLSGRTHTVMTAICLSIGEQASCDVVSTEVTFMVAPDAPLAAGAERLPARICISV